MNKPYNSRVTLLIPVRSADRMTMRCIRSALEGSLVPEVLVIVCSSDGSIAESLRKEFPEVTVFDPGMNPGRAHALNTGLHIALTPYVMTLSPRLLVGRHCVERLYRQLDEDSSLFSVQAKILMAEDPSRIRGYGWNFGMNGEPYAAGERALSSSRGRSRLIGAAMADAAMYRMEALEVTGIFDERFYGKLEDADLGYRAGLAGYRNMYAPGGICKEQAAEKESPFTRQLETGNRIYLRYKITPQWQQNFSRSLDLVKDFMKEKFLRKEEDPERAAATERGRMLCFQAEMELMERTELGMSVTKQTLPEEFCMEVRDERLKKAYPLYLGERTEGGAEETAAAVRTRIGTLLAGAGGLIKIVNRFG